MIRLLLVRRRPCAALPRDVATSPFRAHRPVVAAVCGFLLLLLAPAAARGQEPFPGLDAYIAAAVAAWNVPGLSVAIVRNDSVVYAKGFGVREVGGRARVDENTLFEIGSSTKAFTATLVAMLVSDEKMKWDDAVADYLPTFRLADPIANAHVTLRDALTHRSGIGRGELSWLGSGVPRDEVLRRARYLQPESPFRSQFSYQNIMYLAAGEAAAVATGSTWDALMRQRIFEPLGMRASVTALAGATHDNVARPHGLVRDSAYVKPHLNMDNIAPAGSVLSSALDMAQWLRFQLADGVIAGERLLSSAALRETHTPQIVIRGFGGSGPESTDAQGRPVTVFSAYGLGWMVQDYRRQLMVQHGGNTDGMSAMVGMLPEHGIGVVVLSNLLATPLPGLVMRYIFDRQLGVPEHDWSGEALARALVQRARADSIAAAQPARRDAPAPLPLDAYAGTYTGGLYGDVEVVLEDGALELRRGDWYGPLEYWSGNNFQWTIYPSAPTPPLFIKFEITPNDEVTGLYFGLGSDATLLDRRRESPAASAGA